MQIVTAVSLNALIKLVQLRDKSIHVFKDGMLL